MDFDDVVLKYKRYVEPFIAIFVLMGLIYAGFMGFENYQAKKVIAKDCGWDDGEVRCLCSKEFVLARDISLVDDFDEVIFDVDMDR